MKNELEQKVECIEIEGTVGLGLDDLMLIKKVLLGGYESAIKCKDEKLIKQIAYEIAFVSYGIDKELQDILELKVEHDSPMLELFKARYGVDDRKAPEFDAHADQKAGRVEKLGEAYSLLIEQQTKLEEKLVQTYDGEQDPRMLPSTFEKEAKEAWEEEYSKKLFPRADGKWHIRTFYRPSKDESDKKGEDNV